MLPAPSSLGGAGLPSAGMGDGSTPASTSHRTAIAFFVLINFFIYLDRGIVPGAFKQFQDMIQAEMGPEHVETLFGALTSVFIVGYAVASFAVGQLVHVVPPFRIVVVGLVVWALSAGIASAAPNYWVLLAARGLSGIGEASFQCIVAPFIDDFAPHGSKALWLGAFYAGIPMGTALGYIYGADVAAASPLGWRAPFLAEAPVLLCLALGMLCLRLPNPRGMVGSKVSSGAAAGPEPGDDAPAPARDVGLGAGLSRVLRSPVFVLVSLGYAAYNYTLAGFGAFAPDFLVSLRLIDNEAEASTAFGAVVSGVGLLGTIMGGVATDRAVRWARVRAGLPGQAARPAKDAAPLLADADGSEGEEDHAPSAASRAAELVGVMTVGVGASVAGTVAAVCLSSATSSTGLYLTVTALACLFLFTSNGTAPLAMMGSVAHEDRALAMGLGQIIQHALGDVPAPAVIGALTDSLAPLTPSGRSKAGLELTLFITMAWLGWTVLLWVAALVVACRNAPRPGDADERSDAAAHAL